jgi:amino acid adenylation domain-containing protein
MSANGVTARSHVVPLVAEMAAAAPERIAVRAPDATLSYRELTVNAEHLASELRALGVQPGDLVGLCAERSASLVVGALAIFLAEAAYVAIDPKYPDERIRWMLEDSGARALVGDAGSLGRVGTKVGRPAVVLTAGGAPGFGPASTVGPSPRAAQTSDPAYVVYTSGSTGQPKGVLVEHASLANLVEWHREAFGLDANDRCTQIASPGFDAAIWEIWPSLASGACICVVPDELRSDPIGLRDWLVANRITVTFLPTAVAEAIIGLPWPDRGALRFLLTGGDALGRRPSPDLGFRVVNNYGLSETAVVATSGVVAPDGDGPPSIGRPIKGVVAEVVDEGLHPVEPGAIGELVIGGIAVARGYLNRPELTAERFIDELGGRRYRTGDRVRLRPDGAFDFLGRLDDQLSIRGFRVEPAEVVAALNAHPEVRASVMMAVGTSSTDRRLVAYVVAAGSVQPDGQELNEFLRGFLPEYLLPSKYVWLDELPLTPHGKVDRDALAAAADRVTGDDRSTPVDQTRDRVMSEHVVGAEREGRPLTPTEAKIAPVLAELLDVDHVGLDQNFFLLGGHSMLGAQLIVRLDGLFDVELSLRFLFDHPTLAELAAEVDIQMSSNAPSGLLTG